MTAHAEKDREKNLQHNSSWTAERNSPGLPQRLGSLTLAAASVSTARAWDSWWKTWAGEQKKKGSGAEIQASGLVGSQEGQSLVETCGTLERGIIFPNHV